MRPNNLLAQRRQIFDSTENINTRTAPAKRDKQNIQKINVFWVNQIFKIRNDSQSRCATHTHIQCQKFYLFSSFIFVRCHCSLCRQRALRQHLPPKKSVAGTVVTVDCGWDEKILKFTLWTQRNGCWSTAVLRTVHDQKQNLTDFDDCCNGGVRLCRVSLVCFVSTSIAIHVDADASFSIVYTLKS